MEMVNKQFFLFMELLVQQRLTNCATVSYRLWKWLASCSPIYGTACATASYKLCNCVLRLMEMVSKQFSLFMELRWGSSQESSPPHLWKWLASSSPIYGTALGQSSGK